MLTIWAIIVVPVGMFIGMVSARPLAELLYRIRHGEKMPY